MKFAEIGHLGQDWELKYTQSGKAVASNSLGVGKRRRDESGQWSDEFTSWLRLTVWGPTAEAIAHSRIGKGALVFVQGEFWARPWESADKKGVSNEVTVKNIGEVFLPPRNGVQQPAQGSNTPAPMSSPQQWGGEAGNGGWGGDSNVPF